MERAQNQQGAEGASLLPVATLWHQYRSLKSACEEIHQRSGKSLWSELERLVYEDENLEPLLAELDAVAVRIGKASCERAEDLLIKANVLSDYVDAYPDSIDFMARSLCQAVCEVHGPRV